MTDQFRTDIHVMTYGEGFTIWRKYVDLGCPFLDTDKYLNEDYDMVRPGDVVWLVDQAAADRYASKVVWTPAQVAVTHVDREQKRVRFYTMIHSRSMK